MSSNGSARSTRRVLLSSALLLGQAGPLYAQQPAAPSGGFADGSRLAPPGPAPLPALLKGYPSRPPWAVAGVDFAVGVPAGTPLKDPRAISGPGVELDDAHRIVFIKGNGVDLNGYDFGLSGGWGIYIDGGATGTVIQNSSFRLGDMRQPPVHALKGTGDLTVQYCTMDGQGRRDDSVWAMIAYSGSGKFVAQYNLFVDVPSDAIDFDTGGMTTIVRYNVFENLGTAPGSHPDSVQYVGGRVADSVIAFNTVYQPHPSGMQGIQISAQIKSEIKDTRIQNNTVIAKGPGTDMSYLIAVGQSPDSTIDGAVVADNFLDFHGAYGPFYPPTGHDLRFVRNVDAATDRTLPAPSGTSASDIVDVAVAPSAGGEAAGATVTIVVRFDRTAYVEGRPVLELATGGTALYSGGSGTDALAFAYTLGRRDIAAHRLAVTSIRLPDGARIVDDLGDSLEISRAGRHVVGLASGSGPRP